MNPKLIRNIWAVGRNYAAHAAEMKAEAPTEAFFFLKAGSCLETASKIHLPRWSAEIHYELEIAFWIDQNLNFSYLTLALDLTARDVQAAAKSKGLPWTLAKSFAGACPLGPWIDLESAGHIDSLSLTLLKNTQIVQHGFARDMIFSPQFLLNYVKNRYPVAPFDVLLTGTPEGVGSVKSGDLLEARLHSDNREILTCHWDIV